MNRLFKLCSVLVLAVLVASPAFADDDAKKKKGQKGKRNAAGAQIMKRLEKAELTDEQKGKVKEIVAKHSEELQAANKEITALVGADARKKMAAASKKAREAGKKGKELQAAALEALGLSGDQLEKYKAAQAKVSKLRGGMMQSVMAVLSPEQREKAGLKVRGKKAPKKGAKKGAKKTDKKKKDA